MRHAEKRQVVPVEMREGESDVAEGKTSRFWKITPSALVVKLAVSFGLIVAWWASFHEIACGCISIRGNVPMLYTYSSCYAFSVGSILGTLAAFSMTRRKRDFDVARAVVAAVIALAFFAAAFYVSLSFSSWLLAAVFQTVINATASCLVALFIAGLCDMAVSDLITVVFVALAMYGLFNNMILPVFIYAVDNFYLVALAQAFFLVAFALAASAIEKDQEACALLTGGFSKVFEKAAHGEGKPKVSARPLFHGAVYGLLFGIMHVETSSLIGDFYNRNIPYAAGTLIAIGMFYFTFVRNSSSPRIWPKISSVVFPFTAVSFMLLPYLDSVSTFAPVAFDNASYLYYEALFCLGCVAIARESAFDAAKVLCMGEAAKSGAYLVGAIACHVQLNVAAHDIFQTPIATVVAFVLLVAATFWVGDAIVAKKLWGMRVELSPKMANVHSIEEKCDRLAKRYKLSPKEREIVSLLEQGNSTEDVTNMLYISIYTTRTHIRNIYAKLDVHSRQELSDLLNAE